MAAINMSISYGDRVASNPDVIKMTFYVPEDFSDETLNGIFKTFACGCGFDYNPPQEEVDYLMTKVSALENENISLRKQVHTYDEMKN